MCYFISILIPATDEDALIRLMHHHSRGARQIDNPSVRDQLLSGEVQYLTTRGHCDCSSVLVREVDSARVAQEKRARDIARWTKDGWSAVKIDRALESQSQRQPRSKTDQSDTLPLWESILLDLRTQLNLSRVGLLVGFYSGNVETERLPIQRRDISFGEHIPDTLKNLATNEITVFHFRKGA